MSTWKQILKIGWRVWLAFGFAWKYRNPIAATINDADRYAEHYERFTTTTDVYIAQATLLDIINLESVGEIAAASNADGWRTTAKAFVADFEIFNAAWKIMHDDWRIQIQRPRITNFIKRLRKILPFARPNFQMLESPPAFDSTDRTAVASLDAGEKAEMGVIEIISIIQLILVVLPRVLVIIKKN